MKANQPKKLQPYIAISCMKAKKLQPYIAISCMKAKQKRSLKASPLSIPQPKTIHSQKIIQPTSGTAERQPLRWILYIEQIQQIQEYDYLVKVLLIGDSAVGNLNFCPDLLGTRSAYFRFTFIYLYTCLYVLCNLDPGCLYIYACSYNKFFFLGENCAYNLDMGFFLKEIFQSNFSLCDKLYSFFFFWG